jgi:hypothetical protein
MNLKDIAKKPQLIKMTLDDSETIAEYGEPLEFYTWDRQPIEAFLKMANNIETNTAMVVEVVQTLVLDADGEQVIADGVALPSAVLLRVINKIVEQLGK